MAWITDNAELVGLILSVILNIVFGAKWKGGMTMLAAVIKGVEAAGQKPVKEAVKNEAVAAGVEKALHAIVKKVTA